MSDYVQNVQNCNCTGAFDCKPAGLHPKRQKKKKKKSPQERTPSETKHRNLVLGGLKSTQCQVWDGPKDFPAGLVCLFVFIDKFCSWELLLLGWN